MFREWLNDELNEADSPAIDPMDRPTLALLEQPDWQHDPAKVAALRPVLGPLVAHYLLNERTSHGRPLDPVARFHLGNGARLERINLMADLSAKAIAQSAGIMVNYQYVLADIERNHEAYAEAGTVVASTGVRRLLRAEKPVRAIAAQ
jgi:malonyl-CoA decarboxylase